MSILSSFSRRLYLRLWLAVVGGVAVFALVVGYAWRVAAEHAEQARTLNAPPRALQLQTPDGRVLLQGQATRVPGEQPEDKFVLNVQGSDGQDYELHMERRPRPRSSGPGRHGAAFWLTPPYGFVWMLALVGIAVTVGVFPIIRRLLQRLEQLERSVQRFGEGDLSVRVPEQGHDEVARLAHQFNAAAARIQTLVQSHKALLANASHELRSPLTRLRMGLELMQGQGHAPPPAARAEIERNIAELDQLVDEILLASRLDAGAESVFAAEEVDLVGLAAEECARVDAELIAAPQDDAGALQLRGDPKLLRRALRNLLENARRYSQGEITLALARQGAQCVLRVCDHGPGVPEAQRERIFEPFYRLPGASERSGGVGLGLALVRTIAERHGGSVACQARPDGRPGACFVLRLPVQGSAPGPVAGGPQAAASSRV
ncbi:Signal transduction histidine kinase [Oryzisolibacter propanilivorax]|uniref:histidine kinase n=1 Tax=Oryzisolibacter propanilivorax TaxID=1527607 RepID=A0A1G9QR68_9BURK|nr:ATP-binding protein [Oryzisolibacter propanilivorax]SDM13350.1 Signal transduction histidine kinase [Oryzisolibacter propanilivorax]